MDPVHTESNGYEKEPLIAIESDKTENQTDGEDDKVEDHCDGEEESEAQSLLPSQRKTEKKRRKVNWKDNNGNKLAEVLIYEPSEVGDSDDEEADSCFCTIM